MSLYRIGYITPKYTNLNIWYDWFMFNVPIKNLSLKRRCHHYRWKSAKFGPMHGVQDPWAVKDLYCVTSAVTRGLGFSVSFEWLPDLVASYDMQGMLRNYSNPDPHGSSFCFVWCKAKRKMKFEIQNLLVILQMWSSSDLLHQGKLRGLQCHTSRRR
jgi:hypothetical protein